MYSLEALLPFKSNVRFITLKHKSMYGKYSNSAQLSKTSLPTIILHGQLQQNYLFLLLHFSYIIQQPLSIL